MITVGLLGCGRIGQVHARSLARAQGAKLVAVADAVGVSRAQSTIIEFLATVSGDLARRVGATRVVLVDQYGAGVVG